MKCLVVMLTIAIFGISCQDKNKGELKIEVLEKPEACERKSKVNDMLTLNYTGALENGTMFFSSIERDEVFSFQIGLGQVIRGWDKGLMDMCLEERRRLTIPPHMAYGSEGSGDAIPPDSTLVYDIRLVHMEEGVPPKNVFKEFDTNEDNQIDIEEVSNYLAKHARDHKGRKIALNTALHQKNIKAIFDNEDKDKDGIITHQEFSGPKHDPTYHDEL